jgi:hypothetical protein
MIELLIFSTYSATVASQEIKAKPLRAKQLSQREPQPKRKSKAHAKTRRRKEHAKLSLRYLCGSASLRESFCFFCNACTFN